MITLYMASIDLIPETTEPSHIWFVSAMEFLIEAFLISLVIGVMR